MNGNPHFVHQGVMWWDTQRGREWLKVIVPVMMQAHRDLKLHHRNVNRLLEMTFMSRFDGIMFMVLYPPLFPDQKAMLFLGIDNDWTGLAVTIDAGDAQEPPNHPTAFLVLLHLIIAAVEDRILQVIQQVGQLQQLAELAQIVEQVGARQAGVGYHPAAPRQQPQQQRQQNNGYRPQQQQQPPARQAQPQRQPAYREEQKLGQQRRINAPRGNFFD